MEPEEIRRKNLLALIAHLGVTARRFAELTGLSHDYLRLITSGQVRPSGKPYTMTRNIAKKIEEAPDLAKSVPDMGAAWMERPQWQHLPPADEEGPRTTGRYPLIDVPAQLKMLWPTLTAQEKSAVESLLAAFAKPKSGRKAG